MVPLKITAEMREELIKQFAEKLNAIKDGESTIKVEQKLAVKPEVRPVVIFSDRAFIKIVTLLMSFATEVAWHGTVDRQDEYTFVVEDIMVYPQQVTGATVTTDEVEYSNWLSNQPDEIFEKIRFQAHSHVRMGVNPSSVDLNQQESIVKQLESEDYYIFAIFNKDLKVNVWIYDMLKNAKYDPEDIDLVFGSEEITQELDQLDEQCKLVSDRKSWKAPATEKKPEEKAKQPKAKKPAKKKEEPRKPALRPLDDDDDDDDDLGTWSRYADGFYERNQPQPPYYYSGTHYGYDY